MVDEVFLLKMGEVVLKGLNRGKFESRLAANLRRRLKHCGSFNIRTRQSTVYVEPQSEDCDMDAAWEAVQTVFGVVSLCRTRSCPKSVEGFFEAASSYLAPQLKAVRTFKVEAKRSDKSFPLNSIQLSQQVGGMLNAAFPHLKVDVHNPEFTVYLEVRDFAGYVHGSPQRGPGGLPVGTGGRGVALLSGGIDSPVACYMMAKRGLALEMVHFFSYPYTSMEAKEKVLELARLLVPYCGQITVNIVPFTEIQEELRRSCPQELFTLAMRRFMMLISEKVARRVGAGCLITGESLGQVASQTLEAMAVTGAVCSLPVFRPVIGLDKEEIIRIARKIGTYETSILPYEDCCTVFTPRHPKTNPRVEELLTAEQNYDLEGLAQKAFENIECVQVNYRD